MPSNFPDTALAAEGCPDVDMNRIVGEHDIVFITLDTLRYDVAQAAWQAGELPTLSPHLPATGWERRHTPGSFTYAAHHAFFAGFLPTPARPGRHPRLFATAFAGSETTAPHTWVTEYDNWVHGLAQHGYHTVCIGGVGFFNPHTALGRVLPSLFMEQHWSPPMGVEGRHSTERQVHLAVQRLRDLPGRVMLFLNISAIHTPNHFFLDGAAQGTAATAASRQVYRPRRPDSVASHAAALRYVDHALAPLLHACQQRGPSFFIVCADHGTAYGEDGYHGHRIAHPVVWEVPYAHFALPALPQPAPSDAHDA